MKSKLYQLLRRGAYYGRLLAVGQSPEGKLFVLYAITGRSLSSRSRRLTLKPDGIFVEPLGKAAISPGQKDLLIYPAVLFSRGIAASNGQQTVSIAKVLEQGISNPVDVLRKALDGWDYEPDAPVFTPRISACITPDHCAGMSLIKRGKKGESERAFFHLSLHPGKGFLLATYCGENSNPPAPFNSSPWEFSTPYSTPRQLLTDLHQALTPKEGNEDRRVAVVAMTFSQPDQKPEAVEILNHYESLEARKS